MEDNDGSADASSSGRTAKELENKVLLGRGKSHLNHPGNKYFQDLIVAAVDAYAKEPSVFVKRQMTLKIVERIEEQGGFLRWSSKIGDWETVDLEERRQKVAHALQYRIRLMNNTNGGKRARMKAINESAKKPKKAIPPVVLPTPEQVAAITKTAIPAVVASTVAASIASTKDDAKSPPNQMLQLTEDEKLIVRNFVHNKEDEDGEASGSAEVASAVSLAARAVAAEVSAPSSEDPAKQVTDTKEVVNAVAEAARVVAAAVVEETLPSSQAIEAEPVAKVEASTTAEASSALAGDSTKGGSAEGHGESSKTSSVQGENTQVVKPSVVQGPSTTESAVVVEAGEEPLAEPPARIPAAQDDEAKGDSTLAAALTVPSPLDKAPETECREV